MKKILIADDSNISRMILCGALKDEYEIIEVDNGNDAVAIMYKEYKSLSAVLLDLVMPRMDGFQVLKMRRSNPVLMKIPVIVISSSDDHTTISKVLELGATDILIKPYDTQTVKHCIQTRLTQYEKGDYPVTEKDFLTDLYLRPVFTEKAEAMIKMQEPGYYTISCLNINQFKVINDQYGMAMGDKVLANTADCINRCLDVTGGICCRTNADVFMILYPTKYRNSNEIKTAFNRVVSPSFINTKVRIRIGRYLVDDLSLSIDLMFDRAKIAADSLRGIYDQNIAEFGESMRTDLVNEHEIVSRMESSLEKGEFIFWLQPQYNHASGAMIGAEALVRWKKDGKFVFPSDFIPIFERNGFIYEMDQYIWEQVCIQIRRWIDEGRKVLPISVNISRRDILHHHVVEVISGIIKKHNIPHELIRLEVTETAFAGTQDKEITARVNELVKLGFTVEIDDFGSGYSSLNTLKDVNAEILKLDMRFFENTENTQRSGNIIQSVVRMAKWLGMAVIAEGVETKTQADYLKSIGCNNIQGYYYAKPMPVEDYEKLLDSKKYERKLDKIQTVVNMDNNQFWDPSSLDSLIFNSYVGAACILEYSMGKIEMIRATDTFVKILNSDVLDSEKLLKIKWENHLDSRNICIFCDTVMESCETEQSVSKEIVFHDLPGCTPLVYLRCVIRVIATAAERNMIYCLVENLTEQRLAESKAYESEHFQAILRNTSGGMAAMTIIDDNPEYIYYNDKFCNILGYTKEQFESELKYGMKDLILPEYRQEISKIVVDSEKCGRESVVQFPIKHRDGHIIWIKSHTSVGQIKRHGIPVHITVIEDITEEHNAQEQIRILTENMTAMMADIPGGFVRFTLNSDGKSKTLYANEGFCRLVEMDYDTLVEKYNRNVSLSIHPDDREKALVQLGRDNSDGKVSDLTYRLLTGSGGFKWVAVSGRILHDKTGSVTYNLYFTEPSESKRKDLAVKEILPFVLSETMKSSSDIVFAKDRSLSYIFGSPAFVRFAGKNDVSEIIGKTDYDLFSYEIADNYRAIDKQILNGISYEDRLEPIESDDNIQHMASISKFLLRDSAGEILGIYGIGKDVTNIRQAYSRLSLLTDSIPGGIASFSVTANSAEVIYFNDGFCKMLGCTREEYESSKSFTLFQRVYPDDVSEMKRQLNSLLKDGTPINITFRNKRINNDGYIWLNVRGILSDRKGDKALINAVIFDVTKDKENELRILDSEEKIGFLNNISHNILSSTDTDDGIIQMLEKIRVHFGGLRAYVFEKDDNGTTTSNTYEVCAPGVTREIDNLQNVPNEYMSVWYDAFRKAGHIGIEDISALDDSRKYERLVLQEQNIKSLFAVAIIRNSETIGFIGVDDPTKNMKHVEQLRAIGDYLSVLILRRNYQKRIENDRLMLLEGKERYNIAVEASGLLIGYYKVDTNEYHRDDLYKYNTSFPSTFSIDRDTLSKISGIPEKSVGMLISFANQIKSGLHMCYTEIPLIFNDGKRHLCGINANVIFNEAGKPTSAVITTRDITEEHEKNVEMNLDRERLYTAVMTFAPIMISVNLTQNTFSFFSGDNISAQHGRCDVEYDKFFETCLHAVPKAEHKAFISTFSRSSLLSAFSSGKDKVSLDHRNIGYDKKTNWMRTQVIRVENVYNDDFQAVVISHNIDSEIAYHTLLQKTYDQTLENMPGFVAKWLFINGDVLLEYANSKYLDFMGITAEEAFGKSIIYCFSEQEKEQIISLLYDKEKNKESISFSSRACKSNGEECYLNIKASYLEDKDGCSVYYCVLTDITDLKNQEDFAQQTELLDNIPYGAALYRYNGTELTVIHQNKNYWKLVGRNPSISEDVFIAGSVASDDVPLLKQEIESAIRQNRNIEICLHIRYSNNTFKPFRIAATVKKCNDGTYLFYTSFTPISNETLSVQEMLPIALSTMMSVSGDLSYVMDIDQHYLCCNELYATSRGLGNVKDIYGMTDYDLYDKKLADEKTKRKKAVLDTGIPLVNFTEKVLFINNELHIVEKGIYPIRDANGKVIGIYGNGHDITEQKENESHLRLLTDTVSCGLASYLIYKDSIKLTYFNEGYLRPFGYTHDEYKALTDKDPLALADKSDRYALHSMVNRIIAAKTEGYRENMTIRCRDKNNKTVWMLINAVLSIQDDNRNIINVVQMDITESQEEKERLLLAEESYRIAVKHSGHSIGRYDIATRTLTIAENNDTENPTPEVMTDVPNGRVKEGKISAKTANDYIEFYNKIIDGVKECSVTFEKYTPSGWRWITEYATNVFDGSGKPVYAIVSSTDVTEKREKEAIYLKWQNSMKERNIDSYTLFRCNLNERVAYESREGTLVKDGDMNDTMTFNERTEFFSNHYVHPDDKDKFLQTVNSDSLLVEYYRGRGNSIIEFRYHSYDSEYRWLRLTLELVEYPHTKDIMAFLLFEDIDKTKTVEMSVLMQAQSDPLTGLLNRKTFEEKTNQAIKENAENTLCAVLLMDMDGFKLINDSLGHAEGDNVLIGAGHAICSAVRDCDYVSRMGGDEFMVCLRNMPNKTSVLNKAKQICKLTHDSFNLDLRVSVSLGIAVYPDDGDNFTTLYSKADKALYYVKAHGKNNYAMYSDNMNNNGLGRQVIESKKDADVKRRMLIAEDSEVSQKILRSIFISDFNITCVSNGQDALIDLRRNGMETDVVLLDLSMPGLDGFDVLDRMRTNEVMRNIPVIVVSISNDRDTNLRAIRAGASDYVIKPVDADILRIRVESAISKRENEIMRRKNKS